MYMSNITKSTKEMDQQLFTAEKIIGLQQQQLDAVKVKQLFMYTNIDKATQELIVEALYCIHLKITLPVVGRQKRTLDCGLYATAFATYLKIFYSLIKQR